MEKIIYGIYKIKVAVSCDTLLADISTARCEVIKAVMLNIEVLCGVTSCPLASIYPMF